MSDRTSRSPESLERIWELVYAGVLVRSAIRYPVTGSTIERAETAANDAIAPFTCKTEAAKRRERKMNHGS